MPIARKYIVVIFGKQYGVVPRSQDYLDWYRFDIDPSRRTDINPSNLAIWGDGQMIS